MAPSSVYLHPTEADKFVAGSIDDEWVRIYDYNTAEVLELNKGHHGPVHCVSYTPDGEVAASGSEDGRCPTLIQARFGCGRRIRAKSTGSGRSRFSLAQWAGRAR